MTQEPNINTAPIVFEPTQAALREIATQAAAITLEKDGEAKVSRTRKDLKQWRTRIEGKRKDLKADAIEYGRRVDQAARELTAIIEPEERRLEAEEAALAAERAKAEREQNERKRVERARRLAIAVTFGCTFDPDAIEAMTPEAFIAWCGERGAEKQAREDAERQAAQERARQQREEEARMAEERRVLAEQAAALRRESERQDAERRELEQLRAAAQPAPAPIQMEFPPADQPGKAFISQPLQVVPEAQLFPVTTPAAAPKTCPLCGQAMPLEPVQPHQEPEW